MTTPSQWSGQQSHEPQPNAPQQGASGYGTPPTGQPAAYNGYNQASPAYGQEQGQGQGQGQGQEQGYAQNPYAGGYAANDGNASAPQQLPPPQQSGGHQAPTGPAYGQPGAYPQAGPSVPRELLTFPTLRDELSFTTNRFGMISLASALGGWVLSLLLSVATSVIHTTGNYQFGQVLYPIQVIVNVLAPAVAIVFGVLALRVSGWRNMPAAVGSVVGVVIIVPAVFFFFINLIPFP